jgi:phosphatidylserine decarboxylase
MMIFRLAPPDYHHFHFPCDCTPTKTREFGSDYESVNPVSFKAGFQPLAKNVRHLYILETEKFDRVAMVAVGAMFVGHIVKTFTPEKQYAKGDDAGYFEFGGSTVVLVFKKGTIEPLEQFVKHSEEGIETQVKVGQVVARKV